MATQISSLPVTSSLQVSLPYGFPRHPTSELTSPNLISLENYHRWDASSNRPSDECILPSAPSFSTLRENACFLYSIFCTPILAALSGNLFVMMTIRFWRIQQCAIGLLLSSGI